MKPRDQAAMRLAVASNLVSAPSCVASEQHRRTGMALRNFCPSSMIPPSVALRCTKEMNTTMEWMRGSHEESVNFDGKDTC